MTAAAPTVTRPVGRCPVTRLVIRIRDLWSEPPPSSVRFQFRDRRPRYFPVRSRGGVGRRYARTLSRGQWNPCPYLGASKVGRVRAPPRDARTRCQDAPPGGVERGLPLPCAHAQTRPGRPFRARGRPLGGRLQRRTAPLVRPDGRLHDRRPRPRRLPRSRGAGADEIPGRRARDARFGAQLHGHESRQPFQARDQGSPLRRGDVVVRGGAGGRPGGLPDARPDRRVPGGLLQRERARRGDGPRSWARRSR